MIYLTTNIRHSLEEWCESIVVSFPSCLAGFWSFHPYLRLFSFRKLFVTFNSLYILYWRRKMLPLVTPCHFTSILTVLLMVVVSLW